MQPGWLTRHALRLAVAILLAGCATRETQPEYKLYPGPARPVAELAVVHMGDAMGAEIDGRPVARSDWSAVHLLPGPHTIRWQTEFGVSMMIDADGIARGGDRATVMLQPGHGYTLRADRTTGYGYRMFFWIVDDATGAVVAGTPLP